jgi:hypothetical protein
VSGTTYIGIKNTPISLAEYIFVFHDINRLVLVAEMHYTGTLQDPRLAEEPCGESFPTA